MLKLKTYVGLAQLVQLVMTERKGGAVKLLTKKQKAGTGSYSSEAVGVHCGSYKLEQMSGTQKRWRMYSNSSITLILQARLSQPS